MMRPTRPSQEKAKAVTAAAKLVQEKDIRLVLELSPKTRQNLKIRAAQEGITVKAYLLRLAARDGVEVAEPVEE
jgi:hypothetical protein